MIKIFKETATYLHHVIQTVKDILPGLLGLDAHLHFMLSWGLKNENHFCLLLCGKTTPYRHCDSIQIKISNKGSSKLLYILTSL